MINLLATVAGAYLMVVVAMYVMQRNFMYFPDQETPSPNFSGVPEMRVVYLTTGDGYRLLSWYGPAAQGYPTLALFQGNAGNIGSRAFKARPYLDAGFGVLLVGYRGYGGNQGSPTEEGLFADGRAAMEFLANQGVKPGRSVIYGESLGTGVAVRIAAEMADAEPVGAVVLESPFTSMAEVAAHHYPYLPARWLVKDRYDSISRIAALGAPLLVIHGEEDRTIPIRFGRSLFDAAAEPKEGQWLARGDHNDLYEFGAAELVIEFLRRHLVPNPGE